MGSVAEQWRAAFLDAERQRCEDLIDGHRHELEELFAQIGLEVVELVSSADAGIDQVRAGVCATVTSGDQEPSLVSIRLVAGAANDPQRYTVYATGDCRRCGRLAPLRPGVELPQRRADTEEPAVVLGQALTYRDAAHDCEQLSGADDHRSGVYL